MKLMTMAELKKHTGLQPSHLMRMLNDCKIEPIEAGKKLYYDYEKLEDLLRKSILSKSVNIDITTESHEVEMKKIQESLNAFRGNTNALKDFLDKERNKIQRFITLTQDNLDSMNANLTRRMEKKLKQMTSFYNKGLNDFFTNSFIVDFAEIVMEKKVRGGIHYHLEEICRDMEDGEDRMVSIDFYGDGSRDYVVSKRDGFLVKLRQLKKDNTDE